MSPSPRPIEVVLEVGRRRVFASALEWPGWSRSGRDRDTALAALATYRDRYREVVTAADLAPPRSAAPVVVVEELGGDATTDFGAPGAVASAEAEACAAATARHAADVVMACWSALDAVATTAPAELRKGPRGGGRDRDAIVDHVLEAERAYAGPKLGVRAPRLHRDDREGIATMRRRIVEVVAADRSGDPATARGWPPRYAARRIAWHVLDHAWEMEDRSH